MCVCVCVYVFVYFSFIFQTFNQVKINLQTVYIGRHA